MAAKPKYTMYHSTVLDAGPDAVWAEVRDVMRLVKIVFGDAVESVDWTAGGAVERVPSRYEFSLLPNHDLLRQEVAGRNEVERSLTYRTVAPALCIADYVATYRVLPVSNDPARSYLEWTRAFEVIDDAEPEVVESVMAMMSQQINSLRDYFAT